MLRTLIAASAICATLSTPAFADGHGRTYCGWTQGVYVCNSRYETPYSITDTLCGSGGIDAACATTTTEKEQDEPPKPYTLPETVTTIVPEWKPNDPAKWHDSRSTSLCPKPYRMTEDGCQR